MSTLFLSDVHLDASRPDITGQFLSFLADNAGRFDSLYILGDLFETWVGDDDDDPHKKEIEAAIRRFADSGSRCFFLHGNRDFLIGQAFGERTGCTLLPEAWVTELNGQDVLLMHGDSLCIDDREYQDFRRQVRSPEWQRSFLALPLTQRYQMAQTARDASQAHTTGKAPDILDVNFGEVNTVMRDHSVRVMIHGHTHRPAVHEFRFDGETMTRIVLGDWYDQGSVVVWDANGFDLRTLARD